MSRIQPGMRFRMIYKGLPSEVEVTIGGYRVLKGSRLPRRPQNEFETHHIVYARLRQELIDAGVIVEDPDREFAFSQDYLFDSISAATSVIRGGPAVMNRWIGPGNKDFQTLSRLDPDPAG